jgi:CrcB protein
MVGGRLTMANVWVAIGSALGGVGRYAVSRARAEWLGAGFPWGTLLVNAAGSFLIGLVAGLAGPGGRIGPDLRLFLIVGLCGGFTTFSAFSFETMELLRERHLAAAGANILFSVLLCLAGVWLGTLAAAAVSGGRASAA